MGFAGKYWILLGLRVGSASSLVAPGAKSGSVYSEELRGFELGGEAFLFSDELRAKGSYEERQKLSRRGRRVFPMTLL
jgi:hypothetical protein